MYRGYKYRLYPDAEARAHFARCFGATRYCYNYCVREYDKACAEGRQLSGFDIMALAREHMSTLKWMNDVDYEVKESAPKRFDNALGKFKRHEAERPREHKKGDRPYVSYTTGGVIHVDFKHDLVQLPKIGIVRARLHRTFSGEIVSATVKREADGNYYISICVNIGDEPTPLKPHTEAGTIGIDVGLRHLATLSDGSTIDLPDLSRCDARINMLKQRHERQTPGSRRYNATAKQIARLHRHEANVTKDKHHKTAIDLCRRYDTICMETLNVEGMKRDTTTPGNILFNRQLFQTAPALFIDRIRKKAADTGTNFVSIDRWEPSTKTCSHCGYVLPSIELDTKEWTCPECHTHHDRDHNAAINIRRIGLEQIKAKPQSKQKNTLPPAEGKVKPAKAAITDDERTGKVTGNDVRRPSTQIEEGTAPPRLANNFSHYVTRKSIQPENIWQSIDKLRKTRVMEDSKYGVMEYFSEVGNIIRLSSLCEEFDIRFSRSKYIYTLKGLPEYKKLFDAIQITIPAMLEEVAKEKEDEIRRSVEKHMNKREPSERKYNLSITEGVTGMAYFISSSAVARLAGTSAPLVDNWAMTRTYDNPRPKQFDKIQRIINAYRQIGKMLRELSCNGFTLADARDFNINARKLVQINKVCSLVGLPTSKYLYIYNIFCTSTMNKLMNFLNVTLPNMIDAECLQMQDNLNRAMQGLEAAKIEALNSTNIMRKSSDDVLLPNPEWDITTAKKVAYDIAKYEAMKRYFLK